MNETAIWAMFFASIVAIKEHPRNEKGADLESCAQLADLMLEITKERYQCRLDQLHS